MSEHYWTHDSLTGVAQKLFYAVIINYSEESVDLYAWSQIWGLCQRSTATTRSLSWFNITLLTMWSEHSAGVSLFLAHRHPSRVVPFLVASTNFCNWFSLFVSLHDPGPLIALSSLGTKGSHRPYITLTRLPELPVLQPRSWWWAWVWTGGICLKTKICLPEFSKTFGCLRRSASKADRGRWSRRYFLLISSNDVPSLAAPLGDPRVCVCH